MINPFKRRLTAEEQQELDELNAERCMMQGMDDTDHMIKKIYLDNQGSGGWRDWEE